MKGLFASWRLALACLACLAAAPALAAVGSNGLPLEVGKRWELASGAARQSMSLEVTGRDGDAYVVRWQNPYVNATFHFQLDGAKVLLAALDMGTGLARMPKDTVYFDLDAPAGRQWTNVLGTVAVVSKGRSVAGHANGTEFRLTDPKGAQTHWTLSPTGGFLAFGTGAGAFLLSGTTTVPVAPMAGGAPVRLAPTPAPAPGAATGRVLVGLDSNPPPTAGYDEATRLAWARNAAKAGVNFVYAHPKWTEAEPSAGRYDTTEIDFKARIAEETNAPVSLNLRMIDTNQRAITDAYKDWKFSDDRMLQKLQAVLRSIASKSRGRVRWVTIGNEVNHYFDGRKGEIGDYAQLMRRVLPTVRELFPGALFTINFTNGAAGALATTYAPLVELCDVVSFTYYPLNADFSFQDPALAGRHIAEMVAAAGSRRVLFQEVGFASSSELGSSEEKQALFLENVFAALRQQRGRVIAANFVWMSDLPQSVVDDLGRYYNVGNASRFKAYLGSLGYWGRDGKPKKAWAVFQRDAPGA